MTPETKTAFVHGDSKSLRDGGQAVGSPKSPKSHPAHNNPDATYPHAGSNLGTTPSKSKKASKPVKQQPPNGLSLIDPQPNPNAVGESQDPYQLNKKLKQ